jgi:16S rRNA (cytosine967-C5)-methyltransferase
VLVYAVCSLIEAEGEAQVAAFTACHPGFASEPVDTPLPSVQRRHGRYLLPVDGLDGFYLARLRRR